MHYASIEDISKSFGIRTLFQHISFHIEEGDKIALVARNGTGKSTLLNIIAGKDKPDSGTTWVHKDVQVVLLPQESDYDPQLSVWDNLLRLSHPVVQVVKAYELYLESDIHNEQLLGDLLNQLDQLNAWQFEAQLKQILGRLSLHHLQTPMGQLSGGQRKRVALAQALLEAQLHGPQTLMLLDEPTNHLDLNMIEWLQDYLKGQRVTLLLITHDRYFLDAICNEILELDASSAFVYRGDYDFFLLQKAARHESDATTASKNQNLFRKELEWMRRQPQARTTKSRSRQDAFYELEEKVKQRIDSADLSLQVKMTRLGGKIIELKKVYKSFGEKNILKGFDYTFKKGERIGIIGKNGVGKSTFLRLIQGLDEPDSGKINPGETVVFGNFSQEGLQWKEDIRIIDYVKNMAEYFPLADGSKITASQFLELFAFTSEQQYTYLSKLSGGEKRRLQLLSILFRNPNFLILDEPTNDLDLQTLRILEEFLMNFPGCLLIVSHDRYFMDRVVEHLFVFEGNGEIRDFPGNYSLYRDEQKKLAENNKKTSEEPKPAPIQSIQIVIPTQPTVVARKLSFKEKREFEEIEKEIPQLEIEKKILEEKMSAGNLPFDQLQQSSNRVSEIIQLLEEKEMRWLELSEKAN